jgi:uncharacterized protein (DUF924 family)
MTTRRVRMMLDARAQSVLDEWFGAAGSAEFGHARRVWFKKNAAFDAMLLARFGSMLEAALAGTLASWAQTPEGALALILLLDQFTRNCFRGSPRAFAGDAQALELARTMVAQGDDLELPTPYHRVFAYMPFEHDETLDSQREAVRLFQRLSDEAGQADAQELAAQLKYAHKHAEVIERFGRYPHRNEILGRETSAEERAWLEKKGGF